MGQGYVVWGRELGNGIMRRNLRRVERFLEGGGEVMKSVRLRYSKGVIASMQTVLKFMANATEQTSISLRNKRSMYSARARGELCQKVFVSEAGGHIFGGMSQGKLDDGKVETR